METPPKVSIIIVNFNGEKLLNACLDSVYRKCVTVPFEVIVVDNASSDASAEMLMHTFSKVRLVRSPENLGFGRANNLGAAHARGEYLWLLNNDTIIETDPLPELVQFCDKRASDKTPVGAVGLMLRNAKGETTHSYGTFPGLQQQLRAWFRMSEHYPAPGFARRVAYAIAAALMIPRTVFATLGGFDPDFFMYFEDNDLQYRMQKLRLSRWVLNAGNVIHLEGGGGKRLNLTRIRTYQSLLIFQMKHLRAAVFELYLGLHKVFMLLACLNRAYSYDENRAFLKSFSLAHALCVLLFGGKRPRRRLLTMNG